MATHQDEVLVSPVETEQDMRQAYDCVAEAFGRQTNDAVWTLMNPGWDTEEGRAKHVQIMIKQWKSTTTNKDGYPNAIYLKATLPDPDKPGERRVIGMAIWKQFSFVEGYGDPFTGDATEMLQELQGKIQRFAAQVFASLWKPRIEHLRKVTSPGSDRNPPAIFHLDLCAVDPVFQRRGAAGKLVQAGLEEAKKRGDLECSTEGSAMGRAVYRRLGFNDEGTGDVKWYVDEEFQSWDKAPNVFLRTRV